MIKITENINQETISQDCESETNRRKKLVIHDELLGVLQSSKKELLRFTNAIFGVNHAEDEKVTFLSAEMKRLETAEDKITDKMGTDLHGDLIFTIGNIRYHIEVQTQHDNIMLFRLLDYQLQGLITKLPDSTEFKGEHTFELILPKMAIIQLDYSTEPAADFYTVKYRNAEGTQAITQEFPIIKLWEYSLDSIASTHSDKKLLAPFTVNKHKQPFVKNPDSAEVAQNFLDDTKKAYSLIENFYKNNQLEYDTYLEMQKAQKAITLGFLENYIGKNNPLRKEVERMVTYREVEFKSVYAQAKDEGIAKGVVLGREEGREEATAEYSQRLAEKDNQIAELFQKLAEKDNKIAEFAQELAEVKRQISTLQNPLPA
ncbi:MAG: hypothetical protein FWG68_12185 [Defluviitaleaceae bacterium]|nr:hypothetical protein [Defluviitaleaceae bacterium]